MRAEGLNYLLNNVREIAPIESMYFLEDNPRKCFTFFSHLEPGVGNRGVGGV